MTAAAIKPTLAILVAISALQPIALNLLAPATPALARHFASNYATIQLTLTLFLVAVAVTQLVIGPLSDRFGRRPCVNAGTALFVLGSVLGALAPTTHILLLARVLEGAGGGAVFALSRAIIRDTADRDHAASQIATVTMVMVVAPMLAPWLGGQIETAFGWRAIFWFMTLFGAAVLAFTLARLPETAPNLGQQSSLLGVFGVFPELVRNRDFMLNVVVGSSASSAFLRLHRGDALYRRRDDGARLGCLRRLFHPECAGLHDRQLRDVAAGGARRHADDGAPWPGDLLLRDRSRARPGVLALVVATRIVPAVGGERDRQRHDDPRRDGRGALGPPGTGRLCGRAIGRDPARLQCGAHRADQLARNALAAIDEPVRLASDNDGFGRRLLREKAAVGNISNSPVIPGLRGAKNPE
ncbi:MFS transporter [Bosea sp. UC22_33]|uniref:MFS transporter n=1 Tax=Bosea sp. UC22_33 TaxID=3350165 RepID=UPI00366C5732